MWEGGFFFYLSGEGENFHTFFFQKYVIKCLIMLYIFVFTMGQLLSVHELTVSGERTSVEWFKYRPKKKKKSKLLTLVTMHVNCDNSCVNRAVCSSLIVQTPCGDMKPFAF